MQTDVTPSFDLWTGFFLVVSILGFVLSVYFFTSKKGRNFNLPISILVLGFSFILLEYVFYWTGHRNTDPYLYFYSHSWYLAFGPLLYSYVLKVYNQSFKINLYHFVPAAVTFVLNIIYFFRSDYFGNLTAVENEAGYYFFWTLRSPWLTILSLFVYIFLTRDVIGYYRKDDGSQHAHIQKKWTMTLLRFFTLFTLAYTSYYILVRFSFFNIAWDYAISVTMALGIYAIAYFVIEEPSIFNGQLFTKIFMKPSARNGSQISDAEIGELYNKLLEYIEKEKPYLNNELRMVKLADEIGFSYHLLSQVINEKAHKNFNKFINEYRIKEAEELLQSASDLSIRNIFFEVGFNNKATFYSAFKDKHQCTPLEYRKQFARS